MIFISDPTIDKISLAKEALGGTPSMEDIVQKVAELEYLEEIEAYKVHRAAEYPDFGSQLDHIYHNGVDSWKTNIVDPVKSKYAKVEVDADELATRKATALAEYQLEEYTKAIERLSQYQVALGREEISEEVVVDQEYDTQTKLMVDITRTHITQSAIEPLEAQITRRVVTFTDIDEADIVTEETIDNPAITQDNSEREEAQAIVDATPQSVIDTYNE
jgi:hypothetical protein